MPTDQDRADARENPRVGDVWAMDPLGLNAWQRYVVSVDIDGVWFHSCVGKTWLTDMCDTPNEWRENVSHATLVERGA